MEAMSATLWHPGPMKKKGGGMEVKWPLERTVNWGRTRTPGSPRGHCVSCLLPRLYPYPTSSTAGELGEVCPGFRSSSSTFLWTEKAGKTRGASHSEGRHIGEKKKVRKKEKGKHCKEAAGETSGKCWGLRIWKTDWGLYLDCHDLQ